MKEKCNICKEIIFIEIHEATGKKIKWTSENKVSLHKCLPQHYWCYQCGTNGMAIPVSNPCIHKRIEIGEVKPVYGLERFQ